MALAPATRLGPYEILARLGAGGMGEVYKARDTRLNRLVAIKVAQEKFSERFAREARAIAALNHPNICQLYDVGPDYLVMELVEGAPIATPDSPRKLLDFAMQIADGLAAAHAASIVHRDLKPDNILVTPDGRVKILDFGLAKAADTVVGAGTDDSTRTIGISDCLTEPGTTVSKRVAGRTSCRNPINSRWAWSYTNWLRANSRSGAKAGRKPWRQSSAKSPSLCQQPYILRCAG